MGARMVVDQAQRIDRGQSVQQRPFQPIRLLQETWCVFLYPLYA
jgi:hypothetical protein